MKLESITKNLQLIRENPQGHFALKEDQETLEVVRGTDQKTEQAVLQVFQEAQAIEQETKKPLRVQGTSCAEEIWALWQKHHGSEDRLEFIPIKKVELEIQGQIFKFDRDLLTQSSEFMRILLEGEFKEKNSTTLSPKFVSDLITTDTVEQSLHFFETGSLKENLDVDALLSLWCLAVEWDASGLRQAIPEPLASMAPVDDDLDSFRNLIHYPGDLPMALFLAIDGSQAVRYLSSLRQQISNSSTPKDHAVKRRIESTLLEVINTNQVPLKEIPGIHTAQNALDWLQTFSTDQPKSLFYADFTGLQDFDNPMLGLLTKSCPHLGHLVIQGSIISSDALKHLEQVTRLQSLNITYCDQLEKDALKHLKHVPRLQSLNIAYCRQLEKDALENLTQVPRLRSLNIRGCDQLEADALRHLEQVKGLQSLNIRWCNKLEKDGLKHLEQVPRLQSLDIGYCTNLEADALKHLEQSPRLRSLNIRECHQLEKDALKHLKHVPGLQSLNISGCTQLKADALQHLKHARGLHSLNIRWCNKLEKDALKHLTHVPGLQSLDIACCTNLEADALKHLKHVPGLQNLNIRRCHQLEKDGLKHLKHVPGLQSLNVEWCHQLEKDALKHLKHVPGLQNLNVEWCHQLEADALKHLKHVPRLQGLVIWECAQLDTKVAPDFVKHLI